MTSENREKWVKALRSGEYTQARNFLRVEDSYCCLGVACDLYLKETGLGEWVNDGDNPLIKRFVLKHDYSKATVLPFTVCEWLGLSSYNGSFVDTDMSSKSLSALNDAGASFEDIATIIETKSELLIRSI